MNPCVGLDVSGKMHAAMNDTNAFTEDFLDGLLLGSVPVTNKCLDAWKKMPDKRQEASERVGCSILEIPLAIEWTVFDSSRERMDTTGQENVVMHEVSSIYTRKTLNLFANNTELMKSPRKTCCRATDEFRWSKHRTWTLHRAGLELVPNACLPERSATRFEKRLGCRECCWQSEWPRSAGSPRPCRGSSPLFRTRTRFSGPGRETTKTCGCERCT